MLGCNAERGPPYPASPIIQAIEWAPVSSVVRRAPGSDNWPITWAADDALYTAYGDGWGFEPRLPQKLSLGFAKVLGPAGDFEGINIRSPTGEQLGGGPSGMKASGLLMVDGMLYMWARNANQKGEQCRLAWSSDGAKTWNWADWKFENLGYCAFLNFGRNYEHARDEYVYMYSPDIPSAYEESDRVVLTRVRKSEIRSQDVYEFFAGMGDDDKPAWSRELGSRRGVFKFPGGVNRLDVTYNVPIRRYLMTMRGRGEAGGIQHFSIYDAPEPWGPWTTVFYTETWEGSSLISGNKGWGESQHIPSKWISADGRTLHLVFAGDDSFAVRQARLRTRLSPELAQSISRGAVTRDYKQLP
jgi:hypothetical protein